MTVWTIWNAPLPARPRILAMHQRDAGVWSLAMLGSDEGALAVVDAIAASQRNAFLRHAWDRREEN